MSEDIKIRQMDDDEKEQDIIGTLQKDDCFLAEILSNGRINFYMDYNKSKFKRLKRC